MTASLRDRAAAVLELRHRRRATPLAYARLWDRPPPRTSQHRALLAVTTPGLLLLDVGGGNRTGKSHLLAQWLIACAAGLDAHVETPRGRLYWVRAWLAGNGLPDEVIPGGAKAGPSATVWVGSATNSASVDQIRGHIKALCPAGTAFTGWESRGSQGVARFPNGGQVVTKTYKEYMQDPQTWEGAAVRAVGLDEEPPAGAVRAAFSRLVDLEGRAMVALTALSGTTSSYYREIEEPAEDWYRKVHLYGEDNPHVNQRTRRAMVAAMPAWQRAARDRGERVDPVGRILPWDPTVNEIEPFDIPPHWTRWTGIDWGGRAPHGVRIAEEPVGDGRLILYDEFAPRRTIEELAISDREVITEMKRRETDEREGHPDDADHGTVYRVADSESPGAIVEAARLGYLVASAKKPPGSVVTGLRDMAAMISAIHPLTEEPQTPRIVAMRGRCPVTVAELRALKWAEAKPGQKPQPDPACSDHGPDTVRYVVQYRRRLGHRSGQRKGRLPRGRHTV